MKINYNIIILKYKSYKIWKADKSILINKNHFNQRHSSTGVFYSSMFNYTFAIKVPQTKILKHFFFKLGMGVGRVCVGVGGFTFHNVKNKYANLNWSFSPPLMSVSSRPVGIARAVGSTDSTGGSVLLSHSALQVHRDLRVNHMHVK